MTEIADEGKVLFISQFARQSKEHRARRLRVDARFRCVHRVPKRLRVGIRFWREEVKMMADRKDAWETLRDVENAPAEPDQFPDPDGRRGEPIALRPTAK